MIAIFRIRFDTNLDSTTIWSDSLFENYMHPAIPYSLANFWSESAWGYYDLSYNLFPGITMPDPNPDRSNRDALVDGSLQQINQMLSPQWEDYDIIFLWYAQRTDMFGGGTKNVTLKDGSIKSIPVTVADSNSRFDGVCQELGHSYGLSHETDASGAEYGSPYSVMSAMNESVEFERPPDARLPDGIRMSNTDTTSFIGKFCQHVIGPSLTSAQLYSYSWFNTSPHVVLLPTDALTTRIPTTIYALDYARQRSQTTQLPVLIIIPSDKPAYTAFAVELRRNGGIYDKGIGTPVGPKSGITIYGYNTNGRLAYLGCFPLATAPALSEYYCAEGDFKLQLLSADPNLDYVNVLPYRGQFIGRFNFTPFYNTAFLYTVLDSGLLYWYKQRPSNTIGELSGWDGPKTVGTGWNSFTAVIPAGGNRFYALKPDGVLLWYQHNGFNDGSFDWNGPNNIGASGWNSFSKIIAGSDGVLYAIGQQGELWWYKHDGYEDGSPGWRGPLALTNHWVGLKVIFSCGDGILYAVANDGVLWWYKHVGFATGADIWDEPRQVGHGWQYFTSVFSVGEGIIYAIQPDGKLLWYRHKGWQYGGDVSTFEGAVLANEGGWNDYLYVFPLLPSTPQSPH